MSEKIGRNDPCPCGSGLKYKKCCLNKTGASNPGSDYIATVHPVFGAPIWHLRPVHDCGREFDTVQKFLDTYPHDDYTLSIFDTLANWSGVEVMCDYAEMLKIIMFIYSTEHAEPIEWIGENPVSKSYVVAMPLTRGRIHGHYVAENGKLRLWDDVD